MVIEGSCHIWSLKVVERLCGDVFQVQVEWVGEPGRVEGKRKFFSKVLINKQHEVSVAVVGGPIPCRHPSGFEVGPLSLFRCA